MSDHHEAFARLGCQVLAICHATPALAAQFLEDDPLPFPLLCDPDRTAYTAFGLARASWLRLMRPDVVLGYLRFMRQGWKPQRPSGREDLLQLGGDFLLDAQRRLVFAHRSSDPIDRPTIAELLDAVRAAGG